MHTCGLFTKPGATKALGCVTVWPTGWTGFIYGRAGIRRGGGGGCFGTEDFGDEYGTAQDTLFSFLLLLDDRVPAVELSDER